MAKNFKSSLPKVISKANKDISTIIESDIAKESALLKDLVDQVLKANLEVKKKNNLRITETKRKLAELDQEIDDLNVSIDLVDRETVIEQLNEMIDAENKIFAARQEIRFFDNEKLPERIDNLNDIYTELTSSIKNINVTEEEYRITLLDSNQLLLNKQLEITNEITRIMDETFTVKQQKVDEGMQRLSVVTVDIERLETSFNEYITASLEECIALSNESTSIFTDVDDDVNINEEITTLHEQVLEKIIQDRIILEEKYEEKKTSIVQSFKDYKASVDAKFEQKNKSILDKERADKIKIEEQLKAIRFEIMNAEKKGQYDKVADLLKKFDKVEKSSKAKVSKQMTKETGSTTKKQREKSLAQLKSHELKYVTDQHKLDYQEALEQVKFEEAKILHKIKLDRDGLQGDLLINKKRLQNVKDYLNEKMRVTNEIYGLKLNLRIGELDLMQENEYLELDLIDTYKELLLSIKEVEDKRNKVLHQNLNAHLLIQMEQEYKLKKSIEDIKLDQEINDIDKLILRKRNETIIKNEKLKEELNSEVIFQESLIKIAQKEHELQMIKVKSLYENERSLAEEQVERINLGVQVNDTFVKTTLQNQLLFATQQINCAVSEFEIRVESVNLTHDQEVQYANKKIEYYKQKYEYDKSKLRKELNDKLEDLNYKLLLFTEDKDNKEINKKIEQLKNRFESMIDEIEVVERNDEEIIRYEKVIADADNRQELAINEAVALREQTTSSFQALYDATKEKYDVIQETDQTEETRGIMPLLNSNAVSGADERLQLAIKEADELYHERENAPKAIIEETNKKIEELTNSDETEKFIDEQKALKYGKIKDHKEITDALLEDMESKSAPLKEQQIVDHEKVQNELEELRNTLFKDRVYRNQQDIESDYSALREKEQNIHDEYIKDVELFRKERLITQETISKDTIKLIKLTFKPYKKYIRFASRGVNSQKKDLQKLYDKKLRKRLNEAEKLFKENIPI